MKQKRKEGRKGERKERNTRLRRAHKLYVYTIVQGEGGGREKGEEG